MYEPNNFLDEFEDLSGEEFFEEQHIAEPKHKPKDIAQNHVQDFGYGK